MKKLYFETALVANSGAKTATDKPIPQAKYRELTFKTQGEFNDWLTSMKPRKIKFVDGGRDLNTIWIHKTGEILHSNLQTQIWVGKFVDTAKLEVGLPVWMTLDNKWVEMKGLIVEQINKP